MTTCSVPTVSNSQRHANRVSNRLFSNSIHVAEFVESFC